MTNMAAPGLSLSSRLQSALSQPLLQVRCEEISRVLNESTSKDAGHTLRLTVENIFGVGGQGGWGLRTITRSSLPREFDQLRVFLGASGPLLSLAYRLANDPFLGFEFPVAWLPARSRVEIEDGTPGAFYANKVQNPGPGKPPINILLNAFEYYIFHFAHFLVGGNSQRWSLSWTTAGDALYPTLLEDYLTAFLPCDNSVPPGPPSPPVSPRGVLSPVAPRGANPGLYLTSLVSPIGSPRSPPGPPHHGYLRGDMGSSGAHAISSPIHLHHHHHHHHHHNPNPQLNIWTSQILVQVVMEMWVNQCLPPPARSPARPSQPTPAPSHNSQCSALHACSVFSEHTPVDYRPYWHCGDTEVLVPTSDHVRVVRMLVKHLHFFTNSGKAAQPSPLDDLRKNVWNMYRKSLYQFLCHTFSHWPLDSSFRLVLETWLSYIQPWRYTNFASANSPSQAASMEYETQRIVESRWQGFVAENLLFYTRLFHLLACRLFRLDLSAPRNAQILFRVTKVFSQTNLSSYIREIEDALDDPHLVHRSLLTGGSPLTHPSGLPGVATDPYSTRSLATVARAHVLEMEGPTYANQPMFSIGNLSLVDSLLKYIRRAYDAVVSEQQQQNGSGDPNQKERKGSWLGSLVWSLFENNIPTDDENTAEDIRKTVIHLDTAMRQLSQVFGIMLPMEFEQPVNGMVCGSPFGGSPRDPHFLHQSSLDPMATPLHVNSPGGPVLTNYGRHQLMSGVRRMDLKYEGDPDLKPICTYEIPFLVRWFYSLSVIINIKYGNKMSRAFTRQDPLGYIVRLVLWGPEIIHEYHKDPSGSPTHTRNARQLPARLSLRFQASKHVIGYELAMVLLLYILGLWGALIKTIGMLTLITLIFACILHYYFLRSQSHTTDGQKQDDEEVEEDRVAMEREAMTSSLSH
ncbi:hypothetical protein Pcinc_037144 [Petrolisthes cinctipes]|uniref:Sphingomyelin phosphodiesterase 4 n=1 Tax=Petrolisthes cinctipes TaxID=88211 RepID=A0AAE1BW91_PETCI|nr:hypothetical protein Pcinc_037144 [Petrolisthes cinctipes]